MAIPGRRIRRTRKGDFEVRLSVAERQLVAGVAPQLRAMLDGDLEDPALRRLFPAAYAQDAERDEEYRGLVRDELADRRRAALDTLVATTQATKLSEEEVLAWIGAVNDLRLVIGTRLDVSEDMDPVAEADDPDAPLLALYGYLGFLLEHLVEAVGS